MKKFSFILLISFLIVMLLPSYAFAWANGKNYGNGFGTHDWVVVESVRLAGSPKWLDVEVAKLASDNPDTILHDYYYHVYDVWGKTYGNSPKKVQYYFNLTKLYYQKKDYKKASMYFGYLSHYYSDTCNPLHTDSSDLEDKVHSNYESAAQTRTNTIGENRGWIVNDGYKYVSDVTTKAKNAGIWSHNYYTPLVNNYSKYSYNPTVNIITQKTLNRAVNDLSDIIRTIR